MIDQAQFNRLYKQRMDYEKRYKLTPGEKFNLKQDLEAFKKEFEDLKATAAELPDDYVEQICGQDGYPFSDVIDEVNVRDWIAEVEEFLKSSDDYLDNMYTSRFESVKTKVLKQLQEASKARFLKPLYDQFGGDDYPPYEDVLKWIDSGAADKLKLNWNLANSESAPAFFDQIIDGYVKYKNAGGSRKDRKALAKADPKEIFKQMRCVNEREDTSNADFVFLDSFETEDWLYVIPLTYMACKFVDSYQCGGEGAQWCIGWERSKDYWDDYTNDGNLFVLAFNKKAYREKTATNDPEYCSNELKFMLQIPLIDDKGRCVSDFLDDVADGSDAMMEALYDAFDNGDDLQETPKAWIQNDDPNKVIYEGTEKYKEIFGDIKATDFVKVFQQTVLCDDNAYGNASRAWWWYNTDSGAVEDKDRVHQILRRDGFYELGEIKERGLEDVLNENREEGNYVLKLNCRGKTIKPEWFGMEGDKFDVPTFTTWLKETFDWVEQLNAKKRPVCFEFYNAYFGEFAFEPEADSCVVTINLIDCEIGTMTLVDYSDGEDSLLDMKQTYIDHLYQEPENSHSVLWHDTRIGYEETLDDYTEDEEEELDESRKVTLTFYDDQDAEEFRDEMKQRFRYPTHHSKHQVVHGTSKSGRSVFVESGRSFSNACRMAEKDWNLWKEATKGLAHVKEYDDGKTLACYVNNKHIGTYIPAEEKLYCDDIKYFGHEVK